VIAAYPFLCFLLRHLLREALLYLLTPDNSKYWALMSLRNSGRYFIRKVFPHQKSLVVISGSLQKRSSLFPYVDCNDPAMYDSGIRKYIWFFDDQLFTQRSLDLAVAWEGLFLYDSILFGLTLFKTYKERHRHNMAQVSVPILTLILRDGKSST